MLSSNTPTPVYREEVPCLHQVRKLIVLPKSLSSWPLLGAGVVPLGRVIAQIYSISGALHSSGVHTGSPHAGRGWSLGLDQKQIRNSFAFMVHLA